MQELIRLWKEYEVSQTEKNGESSNSGPTLEIRIPAEHVTATNRQVRFALWYRQLLVDVVTNFRYVCGILYVITCRSEVASYGGLIYTLMTRILWLVCHVMMGILLY